jgi:hypothetical protein
MFMKRLALTWSAIMPIQRTVDKKVTAPACRHASNPGRKQTLMDTMSPTMTVTPTQPIPTAATAMQPVSTPQIINNITVAAPAPTVVVVGPQKTGPGLLVRSLYFLFIGGWLGAFCTELAWLLCATVIGLPLGLMIINRLPQIMTLKPRDTNLQVTVANGVVVVQHSGAVQRGFLMRTLYFVLVGWWASFLWLNLAWALTLFTFGLGLPLAFWMFNRTPAITTLAR